MNKPRLSLVLAFATAAFLAVISCTNTHEPPTSLVGLEKAQVPDWSQQDMDFFLHGSMSTEFAPETVLRSFIIIYPDLFPKSDLSNLGLIPDPAFGWPVGFSRSRPAHLGSLMSVGVNCAACHVGDIQAPGGRGTMRVIGMTSHFDAEAFFAAVIAATYRTQDPANMKLFLAEYLRQSDMESDPTQRATHQELFETTWQAQSTQIAVAMAADPTGSLGAGPGNLQDIHNVSLQLTPATLNKGQDLAKLLASMLKLFHNMRTALYIPDQPPTSAPPLAGGPGRNDAFGLLSAILFNSPQPYAPVKYGLLWNLQDRPYVHWDGNTSSPIARNLLAALGLGAPLIGHHGEIYCSLIERQTALSEQIIAPQYPFTIDRAAARRGSLYYQMSCMGCHEGPQNDSRLHSPSELGTDPLRAQLFTPRQADQLNEFLIKLQVAGYQPSMTPPLRSTQKYWAPSLAGVWARSPYLHNGSVRTLQELLTPSADRPPTFHRGSRLFDDTRVGYTDSGSYEFDAKKPGNSNAGHNYGTGFTPSQKHDLIEYLKTL